VQLADGVTQVLYLRLQEHRTACLLLDLKFVTDKGVCACNQHC
jgi:hypothetical protein